jgi:Na+/proline symporter
VIGLIPAGLLLRGLSGGVPGVTAAPRPPAAARHGWHPWSLAALAALTGAAAVYGGAELIRDGFGMPDGWLAGTPLTGWVLPGVALLIGVAVPQFAAAALIGSGARPALAAGYLAGLLLIAWIAVELLILRRYFFLQPVIAGLGAAEVLLAWRWQRNGLNRG